MNTLTWEQVVDAWRKREDGLWDEHMRQHGHKDWEAYRLGENGSLAKYGFKEFGLEELSWEEQEIGEKELWKILSGPYQGWSIYNPIVDAEGSPKAQCLPFALIANDPRSLEHERIQQMKEDIMGADVRHGIALKSEDGLYVLIDGHHTLTAFGQLWMEGKKPKARLVLHVARVPIPSLDFHLGGGPDRT